MIGQNRKQKNPQAHAKRQAESHIHPRLRNNPQELALLKEYSESPELRPHIQILTKYGRLFAVRKRPTYPGANTLPQSQNPPTI